MQLLEKNKRIQMSEIHETGNENIWVLEGKSVRIIQEPYKIKLYIPKDKQPVPILDHEAVHLILQNTCMSYRDTRSVSHIQELENTIEQLQERIRQLEERG